MSFLLKILFSVFCWNIILSSVNCHWTTGLKKGINVKQFQRERPNWEQMSAKIPLYNHIFIYFFPLKYCNSQILRVRASRISRHLQHLQTNNCHRLGKIWSSTYISICHFSNFQLYHHISRPSIPQHHDNAAHGCHPGSHLDNMRHLGCAHGEVLWFRRHHDLLCGLLHCLLGDYLLDLRLHVPAGPYTCQENCRSASQWGWEDWASAVAGQRHERGPDPHHPLWSVYGVLGPVFCASHPTYGVPHEPILRVLPLAFPVPRTASGESRPHWPCHLCFSHPGAQVHLQEDSALSDPEMTNDAQ